jgi:uncharacterized membrane protein YozB (DUF420 family)
MGLFSTNAPLLSDLSLLLQILVFFLLVLGIYAKMKHRHKRHAAIMGTVLAAHTVSIMAIMVPSLLSMGGLLENLLTRLALVAIAHAIMGSAVELSWIWLLGTWLSNTRDINACFGRKNIMRVTIALWAVELILGVYVYIMLYLPT